MFVRFDPVASSHHKGGSQTIRVADAQRDDGKRVLCVQINCSLAPGTRISDSRCDFSNLASYETGSACQLRRNDNHAREQTERETVEPPSGTPTGVTMTSSSNNVEKPGGVQKKSFGNSSAVIALEAVTVNVYSV